MLKNILLSMQFSFLLLKNLYIMHGQVFGMCIAGMVLVFDHGIMHEGSELKKGRKYCVRTDVMYAPKKTQKTGEDTD